MDVAIKEICELQGKIEKVIFQKDNFMIGVLMQETGESMTFKGTLIGIEKGDEIILQGKTIQHPKFGQQLEVLKWERPIPKTRDKIIDYLSSSFIKGCGEKQAKKIVDKLGENAIQLIMEQGESSLKYVNGIGDKKALTIANSVKSTYELQEIVADLSNYGMEPLSIIKYYEKYGSDSADRLKRNPYELSREQLVTFPEADNIAERMGIPKTSFFRIESCVEFTLSQLCFKHGHCFVYEGELMDYTLKVLNQNTNEKVELVDIQNAVFNLEEHSIIVENQRVYPKEFFTYEYYLSEKVKQILNTKKKTVKEKKVDTYIKEFQLKRGITLAEEQKKAIKMALNENISVLTGSAGTGKTTVVEAILEIYQRFHPKHEISLSAPTGRASRKLEESTGHTAKTNHRLLGYKQGGGFDHDHNNKLDHHFYIIDEMSMVDLQMSYSLLRAMPRQSKVLLIGDIHQLPSVNAGNVLKDIIEANAVPRIQLEEIFRQAQGSQIITNANKVNKGQSIELDAAKNDMYFINKSEESGIQDAIIKSTQRFRELGHDLSDILVLTPMKKGRIGTYELNERLQEVLNPPTPAKTEALHGKRVFRLGDKVMQTVNDPDKGIYNGDIGIITKIGKENSEDSTRPKDVITINFQGKVTSHEKSEWKQLDLAYAITIHKSQGGQSPIVITPVSKSHYTMLKRNLIYTGMTRAESKLIMIGQISALNYAIGNNDIMFRQTTLTERIEGDTDMVNFR
ncbi:ATP-dependent RecD-like DNA helicase [Halobacillus locisalis]|uniref:ATP-dependent RecD2 DNA helicase n=1 Tax=Halobacillus locisalis TaxID=220753 RepID=A0A838CYP0_9BACI|nr:ATP-dependent RecD-like DNA helicase [Halobacillus locisalis]MBA2176879.1 ATP-dependent RecD-like DNA helicase [Halobacillus locisalis]